MTPETHLIPLLLQTAQGRRDYTEVYGTDYDTPDGTAIRDSCSCYGFGRRPSPLRCNICPKPIKTYASTWERDVGTL